VSKILELLLPGKSIIFSQNYPGIPGTQVLILIVSIGYHLQLSFKDTWYIEKDEF
jgi:hypothetical protein